MNNDLISREALKDKIPYLWSDPTDIGMLYDLIDNAPTVAVDEEIERQREEFYQSSKKLFDTARMLGVERPQGEWIPVSERLPEYSGLYLISIDDLVTVANFTGTYFSNRGGVRVVVDAWQPLPEPYKKGGAE